MKIKVELFLLVAVFTGFLCACGSSGTEVPKAPVNVTANPADGSVVINWDPVVGADGYNIYWKNAPKVTTSDDKIADVTSPWYVHKELTNGMSYYYAVTVVNSRGESGLSDEVSATPHK